MDFATFFWIRLRLTSFLAAQNLALRQQLAVLKRTNRRPKIKTMDRLFWVLLSMVWSPWRKSLITVKPQTVIKWHRNGFKHFWRLKSKSRGQGRPQIHRVLGKTLLLNESSDQSGENVLIMSLLSTALI